MTIETDAPELNDIRLEVGRLCDTFPSSYWQALDQDGRYPTEFVDALTAGGWLSVLIPEQYGGGGCGIGEAAVILEEINRSGANAAAAHAQMYTMGALLRHGSERQKQRYLPLIADGRLRLQAFGVTEPGAGSDTTRITTTAVRRDDRYVVNGQKVFISRAQHSDLMLLLARTADFDESKPTEGLSVFLIEMATGIADGSIVVRPIPTMVNHHSTEIFFTDLSIPADSLVGVEGRGFRHIMDSWNAERILVASEAVGDGRWFIEKAAEYAGERRVFGRAVGSNQGVQFPIARAYAAVHAAALVRDRAATLFDTGQSCAADANLAKLLASEASWMAANACMDAHGGYGFAAEYDIERKFRETRLLSTAPVSNNLVLGFVANKVLGMPKSY